MKICVTAVADGLDAQVDPRFGHSQYFVIVDPATMAYEAMPNAALNAPEGAGIQAAQAMVNKGVDVVISGNMGPNAFQVLSTAGVKIATGAYGTVKDAIELFRAGKLTEAGTATVAAHAGMGAGSSSGLGVGPGGGRGGGSGMGRGGGQGQGVGRGGQGRGRKGGSGLGPGGECRCPQCGYTMPHQVGVPCNQQTCPKCGSRMTRP